MRSTVFTWGAEHGWTNFPTDASAVDLVLAFGASELDPAVIASLADRFPGAQIAGCSSAGEIVGRRVEDGSLVGVAVRFERGRARCVFGPVANGSFDPDLAASLSAPDLAAVFVFTDGLAVSGDSVVQTLRAAGVEVPVFGGLAGDGARFAKTWVIEAGEMRAGRVCLVGLYGEGLRLTTGSEGGWEAFGPERTVTASDGSVVREIDGEPALDLYKRYLGDRIGALPSSALLFPLALQGGSHGCVVRTVLAVDEGDQSMTFAGSLPVGSRVRLMRANQDRLVDGAVSAGELAAEGNEAGGLMLAVSCVGRRLVLGERAEEEVEATLAQMPQGTQQIGFYSYGEIAPDTDGVARLHNQTMTVAVLTEALVDG